MRILFTKGKQREMIKDFKDKRKLTWKELSELLKLKEGRLKEYYYETVLIPDLVYEVMDKDKKFTKSIIEKKKDNWGRIKGGSISKGKTKEINLPHESEGLAEFYGIMLGDGNSNRSKAYKIGTYAIRIVGDSRYDRDYLINYVKPLIEKLFNINVRVGKYKKTNAMFLESHSVKLVEFLEGKGFKPGNKIKNKLEIPKWIKEDEDYLKRCLRGLYDTDGSVYKLTNQNSFQVLFTNYNSFLLNDVRNSLLKLGVNCSKISGGKDVYITKKSEIAKFFKVIGFSNPKHINKIKKWMLDSPVV
jgi:intein/homing endonuclease